MVLKIILWLLISYGITQIVVESSIFEPIRSIIGHRSKFFGNMITCMLCAGVWVSFIISLLIWSPSSVIFSKDVMYYDGLELFNIMDIIRCGIFGFMDAMIGSTVIWFLHLIDNRLSN